MAAAAAAQRAAGRIGRFEPQRVIGRGTQATVWLARDPRLERDVALKLLAPQAAAGVLGDWLAEARNVAGLNHPHVVPVYEADVHDGDAGPQPYLVFEYVSGAPLDSHLKARGPFAPREAVEWLLGVVDALAQAHAAGLVHRDLKPSNLLVDAAGRARVTDFGIAVKSGAAAAAAGTPRYVAPETLRGDAPTPAVDVFALGLLLAELMLGRALVSETAVPEVLARIAHTDLALPTQMPQPVDDGLRGVIQRALAREPSARYAHAGELREALLGWLAPAAQSAQEADAAGAKAGALDFLLRRMRHKSDFPALSDSVARIQRVAASEHENLGTLAGEILKDVALTHKLLRLVNTAHYSHAGGGSISTVSRAVALMGFAGVRNLALSLVLVEHMNDKLHAQQIKQEFLRALLAGTLAEELGASGPRQHGAAEEAFLGAMFRNLGRLLTEFYFPEEAEQVRRLVQPGVPAARETPRLPVPESSASRTVLGLSYEELGLGVARHWGLPETLQRCMRLTESAPPPARPPAAPAERLRWIASAANEAADALLQHEPDEAARRLGALAERYTRALGVPARELLSAVARSRARLTELASGLEIVLKPGAPAERLLAPRAVAEPPAAAAHGSGGAGGARATDTLSDLALGAAGLEETMALAEPRGRDRPAAADPAAVLAAGIQDITNSMVEEVRLGEVLRMILETMYRALGFRRVLFCLRDPKSGALVGRFLLGEGDDALRSAFRVATRLAPGSAPDLFTAVCLKGADTLIADATGAAMRARLPGWFLQAVDAPAFLLLPLTVKNAPVGLIYADKAEPGAIVLGEKELSLLRTLRNQAVMAFRQASGG